MKNQSFTVLTQNRPTRIAFLVCTDVFPSGGDKYNAILEAIISWNYSHWGGRANQVIVYSGDTLSQDTWRQLEIADPDFIHCFSQPSENLIKELEEKISPWAINLNDKYAQDRERVFVDLNEMVGTPPTPNAIKQVEAYGKDGKLLLFEFSNDVDPTVERFFHVNFGTFEQCGTDSRTGRIMRIHWLENLLSLIPTCVIPISSVESASSAITQLFGRTRANDIRAGVNFIAPYQLASMGLRDYPYGELDKTFQIIVGDTPDDFSEFWNGALRKKSWAATHKHQLWLPGSLALNDGILDAISDWIDKCPSRWQHPFSVELISKSYSAVQLEEIAVKLRSKTSSLFITVVPSSKIDDRIKRYVEDAQQARAYPLNANDPEVSRFTGNSSNEVFPITPPLPIQEPYNRAGGWMVDTQIQQMSSFQKGSWWHLPRLNSRGLLYPMFHKPARIINNGLFSVFVGAQVGSTYGQSKPELELHIPQEGDVIPCLINQPSRQVFFAPNDVQHKNQKRETYKYRFRISDKGGYLAGLINLFGGLRLSRDFCERRFWRKIFYTLAGHGAGNDDNLHSKIDAYIKEWVENSKEHPKPVEKMTEKIISLVRGRLQGNWMKIGDFQKIRSSLERDTPKDYIVQNEGGRIVQRYGDTALSENEMRRGIDRLLELGILQIGLESVCQNCGLTSWYQIGDLSQKIICKGCGSSHFISNEPKWNYSLNSLVKTSVFQGVFGCLHALTSLTSISNSFSAYSPNLEVFKGEESEAWCEIDILCVVDGKFIIGEVKEGQISDADFIKLAEIAEELRPQRAILFLPLEKYEKQVAELPAMLSKAKVRLEPQGISVEIYPLPTW